MSWTSSYDEGPDRNMNRFPTWSTELHEILDFVQNLKNDGE